ncbi:MAG TPA: hypothetical protein VF461_24910 [Gemmatimonadaceae bacterium]
MNEVLAFQATLFVCGTVSFVATLHFIRRFLELRHERPLRAPTDDLAERLARIESTVEATALEVERVAEANRFVAKVLSERVVPAATSSRTPERVITPH